MKNNFSQNLRSINKVAVMLPIFRCYKKSKSDYNA